MIDFFPCLSSAYVFCYDCQHIKDGQFVKLLLRMDSSLENVVHSWPYLHFCVVAFMVNDF